MKKLTFLFTLSLLLIYGCSKDAQPNDVVDLNFSQENTRGPGGGNGIIHHASLGGNDACEAFGLPPGCDKNFSLVANEHADGSVSGQWVDEFGGDVGGIHVSIDCLTVVGNYAIVSGFITRGSINGNDLTGEYAVTAIWDNGTSNNDPNDQLTFSSWGWEPLDGCNYDIIIFEPLDLTRGQVRVW